MPVLAFAGVVLATAGCETRQEVVDQRFRGISSGAPRERDAMMTRAASSAPTTTPDSATPASGPANAATTPPPTGASIIDLASERVRVGLLPLGAVPYDRFTLPLVSPDGRFVATQTGRTVDIATRLAAGGAGAPSGTRIEIFALPEAAQAGAAELTTTGAVTGPYLLGRGGNADGFLIEAPHEDGSRRIGRAAWRDGTITWLLDDPTTVHAFAADGPAGRLAWSSRNVDAPHFDLRVRTPHGSLTLPADGGDWLLPRFGAGDGLFALRLESGRLDLVHFTATDQATAERTMQRETIAGGGANVDLAFSVLSAVAGDAASANESIAFYHPDAGAAAVWTPGTPPTVLERGSYAAALDPDDPAVVLTVTGDDLLRVHRDDQRRRARLIRGTHVPRRTAASDRPWVLLAPESGRIGLTLMQILPVETRASVTGAP